jgi:hypothetical protein
LVFPSWLTLPVVLSTCGLVLTAALFWVVNLRRGRVVCPEPRSFAAVFASGENLISLPLGIHNNGARHRQVQDLRLTLEVPEPPGTANLPGGAPMMFSWRASRDEVQPRTGNKRTLPAVFALNGRTANTYFIEFGHRQDKGPKGGPHRATVEVKLSDEDDWRPLVIFDLHTERVIGDSYMAYSNDPTWEP